jgi:hypothetical protein
MKVWVVNTRGCADPYVYPEEFGPQIRAYFLKESGLPEDTLDGVYTAEWGNEVGIYEDSMYIDDGDDARLVTLESRFTL